MSLRKTIAGAVLALGMAMGSSAFAATIVNLGFAIDDSGSIVASDFNLQKNGLANALAQIPVTGDVQYRVGVVKFASSAVTVVDPVILTAANLQAVQDAIRGANRTAGLTATGDAINRLVNIFQPHDIAGNTTLFNISTDGAPNTGASWVTASADAFAAGVDGISFEAVGNFSQSNINLLIGLAGPNGADHVTDAADLPDPTKKGFVFEVNDFDDYEAAITAKIAKIVDVTNPNPSPVPVPAALPLLLGALGMMGAVRLRRRAA